MNKTVQWYWESEKPSLPEDVKVTLCNALISHLGLSQIGAANYIERGSSITTLVNQDTAKQ